MRRLIRRRPSQAKHAPSYASAAISSAPNFPRLPAALASLCRFLAEERQYIDTCDRLKGLALTLSNWSLLLQTACFRMNQTMMTENNAMHPARRISCESRDSKAQIASNTQGDSKPRGAALVGAQNKARPPVKRRRTRKRLRLGDAVRKAGLDEHKVAETYVDVVDKLRSETKLNGSIEKVLADVLKECSRVLEPLRPSNLSGAGDAPTPVHLVHKVLRPKRNTQNHQGLSRLAETNADGTAGASKDVPVAPFTDMLSKEDSQ
jgi:hypothetical protein